MRPPNQWVAHRWLCPIDGQRCIVLGSLVASDKGRTLTGYVWMPSRSWHHYLAHRRILAPAVTEQYRARQIARRRRGRRS
jgi:hypothetical protein